MMKAIIFILSLVFTVSTVCASAPISDVVGKYNGYEVTSKMVMKEFSSVFTSPEMKDKKFADLDPKLQENLVTNYIVMHLLDEKVQSSDIKNSKEFKEKMRLLSETVARSMFLADMTHKSITQKEVDEQYNKILKEMKGKKSIEVSHILLPDEKSAIEVKDKINKGMKFADAAKAYSKDSSTKSKAGSLGKFNQGELAKEFEDAAYAMEIGQVSKPVKTHYGWHLILLHDIVDVKIPAKRELESRIRIGLANQAQNDYLQELLKKSNVTVTLPSQSKH